MKLIGKNLSYSRIDLLYLSDPVYNRILELGFGKAIEDILECLQLNKAKEKLTQQNLLLSATLNEKVNRLAQISLDDPIMIGLHDDKIADHLSDDNEGVSKHLSDDYNLPEGLTQRYVKGKAFQCLRLF